MLTNVTFHFATYSPEMDLRRLFCFTYVLEFISYIAQSHFLQRLEHCASKNRMQ